MFRKDPDYYQNVVLLRRITGIWTQMEEYLFKEGLEEPGAEIMSNLAFEYSEISEIFHLDKILAKAQTIS